MAARLTERRFDAIELRGPGTKLTIGLLPTATWSTVDFSTAKGLRHFSNLPSEEVFTTPDPRRTSGQVTATKPLVRNDGTIIRGRRARFEDGVAVEIDADENAEALRGLTEVDEGARRLGELALVDGEGRIGPLDTVFYNTLLDEHRRLVLPEPHRVDGEDLAHWVPELGSASTEPRRRPRRPVRMADAFRLRA